MKKILTIFGIIILVVIFFLSLRFIFGGPEDTWICKSGEWIKHGMPSAPKPVGICGGGEIKCVEYLPDNCPEQCVVCPPCPECSSISCQTEEFCSMFGIDRKWYKNIKNKINNFFDCVAAGNAVMESYPAQCSADGETFVEDIGNELEKVDLIRIDSPRPNQIIKSPLFIDGQAVGSWFFEGSFPVILVDWDGLIIAEGVAMTESEWMTDNFVPFKATLEFDKPILKNNGALILRKDNPSDLPENDDALEIPIFFD